ncbi:MAG: TonB-dependent receptor, partial [Sphingomicrobium sp.]
MFDLPPEAPAIVVTASRAADEASQTPASVTLIDAARIERLGAPLIPDLLRLVPSVAVAIGGPAGSFTQVRIRGAEANHTLLFVEGIAANDPAAGSEPRFELLNADLPSKIEVVRGPQSALWGSEAIGGVVAVNGAAPGSGGTLLLAEYGSADTARAAARTSFGDAEHGLSIGIAGQRSDGIDSFDGTGDRDGYRNLGLRAAGRYRLSPSVLI